jgi:PPOX class probable F420-dependent enzyme
MVTLPDSAVALIESGASAHMVTLNRDGSPQLSLVWAGMEDGEICVGMLTPRQKLHNVRRDPRVALQWESPETDPAGLTYYLVVMGTARVTEGGSADLVRRLATRRLPAGTKFPRGDSHPPGWIIRVKPERWRGYGPWAGNA